MLYTRIDAHINNISSVHVCIKQIVKLIVIYENIFQIIFNFKFEL